MIKRALISLSDKTGIVPFAKFLTKNNVEILSTGGTAKLLRDNRIPVKDVSEFTGFPEVFSGRVKTLHPKVHGGLLYLRGDKNHEKMAKEQGIEPIDLVVVNLYPFAQTIADLKIREEEAIEQIDIGGPSMLRSAAKNFRSVTVLTDPEDYKLVQEEIATLGDTTLESRRVLAGKVFALTSGYDAVIANYFDPDLGMLSGRKIQDLRYGENPHQQASFYENGSPFAPSLATSEQLQGKELSFNNILDGNAALLTLLEFSPKQSAAVIVKHLTPCGVAQAKSLEEAFTKAHAADPTSAFGGIVALNQEVSEKLAKKLAETFFEIIIAPKFSAAAKKILAKKEALRLLAVGNLQKPENELDIRSVLGGFLIQDLDTKEITKKDLQIVTKKKPTTTQLDDLLFAWKVCKHVKSNAIVLAKNQTTLGVGGGQTSRVGAAEIALNKAKKQSKGAVCASDAFFPFADSIELLAESGVSAIIQPGGSKRDDEVIAECDKRGITMVFTNTRAFLH